MTTREILFIFSGQREFDVTQRLVESIQSEMQHSDNLKSRVANKEYIRPDAT